jgi:hypothetical protein
MRSSNGYFREELLSSSSQDAGYRAPAILSPSPSTGLRLTLPHPLPSIRGGLPFTSGMGNLSDNTIEPPYTSHLMRQYSNPALCTTASARNSPGPTMTPQLCLFENPHAPDLPRAYEAANVLGGTKNKKRRGNLPKEATDKLQAWFVAHLHHPYPREYEKQELMNQTKLKISMS